ncbi:hypothetical protein ACQCVK_05085 [Rossellomorea vietnamensis]|uniref:hypothetical protein n=1 Tax=Rossellomorea vietnamensis TaxID=218284 RepID=UPI003CECAF0B
MFGKKKCKHCKRVVAKSDLVMKEYCSDECKDQWREENLRPWQKKLNEGVEKWAADTKKKKVK